MIRDYTELETVKFECVSEEMHADFKQEIEFYTRKKLSKHKKEKHFAKRQDSCNQDNMFDNLLELIEKKSKHKKMPVRKFFNNTFGTLLNDAIFALKKK